MSKNMPNATCVHAPSLDSLPNSDGMVPTIWLDRIFRYCRLVILPKTDGKLPDNSLKDNARYSNAVSCCMALGMLPVI
jgi:hypothetical protein